MALQSIRYEPGKLEILDQLLLPVQSKYVNVRGVEDGWRVINKMQVSWFPFGRRFAAAVALLNAKSDLR